MENISNYYNIFLSLTEFLSYLIDMFYGKIIRIVFQAQPKSNPDAILEQTKKWR